MGRVRKKFALFADAIPLPMRGLSRHQYWTAPARRSRVRSHFHQPWRAPLPTSFPSLEACSRRHYVALHRFPILFRLRALPSRPSPPGPGLEKFLTESRTAKTAVLLISRGFFPRFHGHGRHPRAGGARQKSCSERKLRCTGGQALEPRQVLPKRGKGIDPDSLKTTSPKTGAVVRPLGAPPCKGCIAPVSLCWSKA